MLYITGEIAKRIEIKDVMKILIPIPCLEEQRKIASSLSVLQKLNETIKEEEDFKPEIREKQYKYYLNKLLDYKNYE